MTESSWLFLRRPGRDYGWSPGKPTCGPDFLAWLEKCPAFLTGRRDKSQLQPIVFKILDGDRLFLGTVMLGANTDEYGRPVAEVALEARLVASHQTFPPYAGLGQDFTAVRFDQNGYQQLMKRKDRLDKSNILYYFGPEVAMPTFVRFDLEITERASVLRSTSTAHLAQPSAEGRAVANSRQEIERLIAELIRLAPSRLETQSQSQSQPQSVYHKHRPISGLIGRFFSTDYPSGLEVGRRINPDDTSIVSFSRSASGASNDNSVTVSVKGNKVANISNVQLVLVLDLLKKIIIDVGSDSPQPEGKGGMQN